MYRHCDYAYTGNNWTRKEGLCIKSSWWRDQMETVSVLLAICAGNSPIPGEFPAQRPVTRGFEALFDLRPNKRLSKQSWGWWFETPSRPLWLVMMAQHFVQAIVIKVNIGGTSYERHGV